MTHHSFIYNFVSLPKQVFCFTNNIPFFHHLLFLNKTNAVVFVDKTTEKRLLFPRLDSTIIWIIFAVDIRDAFYRRSLLVIRQCMNDFCRRKTSERRRAGVDSLTQNRTRIMQILFISRQGRSDSYLSCRKVEVGSWMKTKKNTPFEYPQSSFWYDSDNRRSEHGRRSSFVCFKAVWKLLGKSYFFKLILVK